MDGGGVSLRQQFPPSVVSSASFRTAVAITRPPLHSNFDAAALRDRLLSEFQAAAVQQRRATPSAPQHANRGTKASATAGPNSMQPTAVVEAFTSQCRAKGIEEKVIHEHVVYMVGAMHHTIAMCAELHYVQEDRRTEWYDNVVAPSAASGAAKRSNEQKMNASSVTVWQGVPAGHSTPTGKGNPQNVDSASVASTQPQQQTPRRHLAAATQCNLDATQSRASIAAPTASSATKQRKRSPVATGNASRRDDGAAQLPAARTTTRVHELRVARTQQMMQPAAPPPKLNGSLLIAPLNSITRGIVTEMAAEHSKALTMQQHGSFAAASVTARPATAGADALVPVEVNAPAQRSATKKPAPKRTDVVKTSRSANEAMAIAARRRLLAKVATAAAPKSAADDLNRDPAAVGRVAQVDPRRPILHPPVDRSKALTAFKPAKSSGPSSDATNTSNAVAAAPRQEELAASQLSAIRPATESGKSSADEAGNEDNEDTSWFRRDAQRFVMPPPPPSRLMGGGGDDNGAADGAPPHLGSSASQQVPKLETSLATVLASVAWADERGKTPSTPAEPIARELHFSAAAEGPGSPSPRRGRGLQPDDVAGGTAPVEDLASGNKVTSHATSSGPLPRINTIVPPPATCDEAFSGVNARQFSIPHRGASMLPPVSLSDILTSGGAVQPTPTTPSLSTNPPQRLQERPSATVSASLASILASARTTSADVPAAPAAPPPPPPQPQLGVTARLEDILRAASAEAPVHGSYRPSPSMPAISTASASPARSVSWPRDGGVPGAAAAAARGSNTSDDEDPDLLIEEDVVLVDESNGTRSRDADLARATVTEADLCISPNSEQSTSDVGQTPLPQSHGVLDVGSGEKPSKATRTSTSPSVGRWRLMSPDQVEFATRAQQQVERGVADPDVHIPAHFSLNISAADFAPPPFERPANITPVKPSAWTPGGAQSRSALAVAVPMSPGARDFLSSAESVLQATATFLSRTTRPSRAPAPHSQTAGVPPPQLWSKPERRLLL